MKINSIYIASFGKFKDFTFDFTDGFNLIYGDNEDGKTTIMAFIKMMFYGSHTKSSDLAKNPRKRYTPWDSNFMAGSVDFTHNGTSYRLEREFKGNSTDKISLINLDLGTKTPLSGKTEPGAEFFGLSVGAFEKSLFVGNFGSPEKDELADGEINSKLSNIITTGDEDISFEMVKKRILKAKEIFMSKGGKKGVYDLGLMEESALESQLILARKTESQAEELEAKIKEKESLLKDLSNQANTLFETLKNAERIKKRTLLEKYVDAASNLQKIQKMLTLKDGQGVTEDYLNSIETLAKELDDLKEKIDSHSEELTLLLKEINALKDVVEGDNDNLLANQKSDVDSKLSELRNKISDDSLALEQLKLKMQNTKAKSNSNLPLVIIGVSLAIVGAISFTSSLPLAIGLFALSLILIVLGFALKKKPKTKKDFEEVTALSNIIAASKKEYEELNVKADEISALLNNQLIEKGSKKILLDEKKQELLTAKQELLSLKEEAAEKTAKLLYLCNNFKAIENISQVHTVTNSIKDLFDKLKEAEIHKNIAAEPLGELPLNEAIARLDAINADHAINGISQEQLDSAKDVLKQKTEEVAKLRSEISVSKTELKALTSGENTLPVLERKLKVLRENLDSQKEYCDKLDIVLTALEEAFIDLRQNYSSALEEKTSALFSKLTEGHYKAVNVSKNFDINVTAKDSFGLKEWQYLSSGTTDQAYLSLRLGLASLIENENEPLPIFLDDVLAQYDDKRALTAINFLKSFSLERQVILFTCHSYFAKMGEDLGVNIKNLKG